jgi:hypothetical protein
MYIMFSNRFFVPPHPCRCRKAACEKIRAFVSLQNMHLLDGSTGVAPHLALHGTPQSMLEAVKGDAPSPPPGWDCDWVELARLIMTSSVKWVRENERRLPFDPAPPGEEGRDNQQQLANGCCPRRLCRLGRQEADGAITDDARKNL